MKKTMILIAVVCLFSCGEEDTYCFDCQALYLNSDEEVVAEYNEQHCGWSIDQAREFVGSTEQVTGADGAPLVKWIKSCRGANPAFLVETEEMK